MPKRSGKPDSNIAAPHAVADMIRLTMGPWSMLKMLLDPMRGVVITNDGNCILCEMDISHPTAKSMIELSRSQDEEVGDGNVASGIGTKFDGTILRSKWLLMQT
jgi:T-complex protein 1 subunit gamma